MPHFIDFPRKEGAFGLFLSTRRTIIIEPSARFLRAYRHVITSKISLKLPYSTVYKAVQSCSETPRKHPGRRPVLDTPIRRCLVAWATINAFHRRLPLEEIAQMEGIEACRRTLITASISSNTCIFCQFF